MKITRGHKGLDSKLNLILKAPVEIYQSSKTILPYLLSTNSSSTHSKLNYNENLTTGECKKMNSHKVIKYLISSWWTISKRRTSSPSSQKPQELKHNIPISHKFASSWPEITNKEAMKRWFLLRILSMLTLICIT